MRRMALVVAPVVQECNAISSETPYGPCEVGFVLIFWAEPCIGFGRVVPNRQNGADKEKDGCSS